MDIEAEPDLYVTYDNGAQTTDTIKLLQKHLFTFLNFSFKKFLSVSRSSGSL